MKFEIQLKKKFLNEIILCIFTVTFKVVWEKMGDRKVIKENTLFTHSQKTRLRCREVENYEKPFERQSFHRKQLYCNF